MDTDICSHEFSIQTPIYRGFLSVPCLMTPEGVKMLIFLCHRGCCFNVRWPEQSKASNICIYNPISIYIYIYLLLLYIYITVTIFLLLCIYMQFYVPIWSCMSLHVLKYVILHMSFTRCIRSVFLHWHLWWVRNALVDSLRSESPPTCRVRSGKFRKTTMYGLPMHYNISSSSSSCIQWKICPLNDTRYMSIWIIPPSMGGSCSSSCNPFVRIEIHGPLWTLAFVVFSRIPSRFQSPGSCDLSQYSSNSCKEMPPEAGIQPLVWRPTKKTRQVGQAATLSRSQIEGSSLHVERMKSPMNQGEN